ncbi:DUF1318 domain-containing protein [Maridesulfovibrio hydrothermalis]|uniref:DUF1318 domain-containing protein n=1 Tax=Maridesulfovibrio hydrothermalis AM13 = DSM 14728 TaxID=1121451 RepID=L0RC39_9BACT|nr:DUF1318 domain-containing protein [Maridesulfovibrio hydrothermalis]CCO23760.1 conserved exported protein of unknown function [Maridesulfovibrio hydrothermalis AM13 = DSM 14728]
MIKKTAQVLTILSLLSFVACVTVNIYFPAAQVERAAEDIVEDVYGTTPDTHKNKDDQSSLDSFLALITPDAAHAQSVSESDIEGLNKSNSAIRGLKKTIADDHRKLLPYYNSGNIGINNQGYIEIINKTGLNIKDTAKLRRLVSQDNNTREQLYSEVAASMNIPGSEINKIKTIFADVWQKRAPSGWLIQDTNGNWAKK